MSTRSGIGQDGYLRVQKQAVYATALTNAMTLLPVKSEAKADSNRAFIENDDLVASRIKQAPNLGREVSTFEIPMNLHPSLVGLLMHLMFGDATTVGPTDDTYLHTFLAPIAGERVGHPFTIQQAKGGALADTFRGGKIHTITLTSDTEGNILITLTGTCAGVSGQDVTRITSFSYPANAPYSFGMVSSVSLTPSGDSAIALLCDSFEISIDLGQDESRFKVGAGAQQVEPLINTIPSATVTLTIDSEKRFVNWARAHKEFALTITLTHTEYAGGTTPFLFVLEFPSLRLPAETIEENANDQLKMTLGFIAYGGTTTGSGSTEVLMEARVKDATTSYTTA
jgi:hypothetical protein